MPTLFRVESADINSLNALQLTKLLKLLLHFEARSSGITERSVDVGLNINVKDGGEDGRIQWNGEPLFTEFLPKNLVLFQNKATEIGPADCAKEIVNKDGSMKRMVESVLDEGGAYILFTTQELNGEQKVERIEAIRQKLRDMRKEYAKTAIIEIYDASKIEGWVNKYISAIVAVLNFIGKPLERGLKTWEDWSQHAEYSRFKFIADEEREKAIKGIRNLFNSNGKCARIIGLSGIGKTRLAFEVFRDTDDANDLSKRVIYTNANATPEIYGLISDWVQCELEGIVVVDDCDFHLHDSLMKEVKRSISKINLLTLDYNPERNSQTETIQLKPLRDEYIKQMIEPVYGKEISDLDRIISFAQGFPQMAVLLAKARLDKDSEMGKLTDDVLAHRLLWGSKTPSLDDEQILRGCSLFDRFGLEGEASGEYKFIANTFVSVDVDRFYDCVKRFEERGIIDRRGRFARLVPKPLAIRLAAEWWRRTRPDRLKDLVLNEIPPGLVDSFCNQISYLDFLPEVKELTKNLCGTQGPFGQAEVILSERGSRLFRSFVEVDPISTSSALLNILQKLNEKELFEITDDIRRNIVRALEKLCFHADCFEKAAYSLLLLASSENEEWGNNASGIFKQLFRTFLSGTAAPPSVRLQVIDKALQSENYSTRELAVFAMEKAIDIHGGSRMVGAEYQGSGQPLDEWRPKVWGEIFEYWEQILNRLCNLVIEKDPLAQKAKNSIAHHIRNLMRYGRIDILEPVIQKIVEQDGPLWPAALESIKDSLKYDSEAMPAEGNDRLRQWIKLLTPIELSDRLYLYVTTPPYEDVETADGAFEDIAVKNVTLLAVELAADIEAIVPFIDQLLSGEQRLAYVFGRELIKNAGKWDPLLKVLIEKISVIDNPNISLLLGILNGIYNIDKSNWSNIVRLFYESENLNKYYAATIVTGAVTIEQLDLLTNLIRNNRIEAASANILVYGRPLEHLSPEDVLLFIKNLTYVSDSTAWVAFHIISMYCHGDYAKWNTCKPLLNRLVTTLKLNSNSVKQSPWQSAMYHWHDTVKRLLLDEDIFFAINVVRQIIENIADNLDYGDIWDYIQPVVRQIFQKYAKDVWPFFSEAIIDSNSLDQLKLNHLLGSGDLFEKSKPSVLSEIPDEIIEQWCIQYPETGPEFVAQSTNVISEIGGKFQISHRARFLLDNFGDNEHLLSAISSNLSSFGWSGSLVPHLQKELVALESLLNHKNLNVRMWINERIDYLKRNIEKESRRDEERDWGIY